MTDTELRIEALELPDWLPHKPLPRHFKAYLDRAPDSDRLVLKAIWYRSIGRKGELGWARIGWAMLIEATGLTKRSIARSMKRLQQAGLISKANEPHWLRWYNGCRYWLH